MAFCDCYPCCCTPNEAPGLATTSDVGSPVAGVPCAGNPNDSGLTSAGAAAVQGASKASRIETDTFTTIKSLTIFGGTATPGDVWNIFSSDVKAYYGQDIFIGLVILLILMFFFIFWTVRVAIE